MRRMNTQWCSGGQAKFYRVGPRRLRPRSRTDRSAPAQSTSMTSCHSVYALYVEAHGVT